MDRLTYTASSGSKMLQFMTKLNKMRKRCVITLIGTFLVLRRYLFSMYIEIAQNHRSVHLLDPAVREVDVVGPGGHRAVPLLVSTKVRTGVVVGDGVGVCVHLA